jgi:hypothetical protein
VQYTQGTNSDTEFLYMAECKCTCTEHQARIHWYTCHCVDTGYWHTGNTTGSNTAQYMTGINNNTNNNNNNNYNNNKILLVKAKRTNINTTRVITNTIAPLLKAVNLFHKCIV